jgi:hypothetical protein
MAQNVPQEHRNLVSGIVFSKEDKKFLGEAFVDLGIIKFNGTKHIYRAYNSRGKVNPSISYLEEALYHEIGHFVATWYFGDPNPYVTKNKNYYAREYFIAFIKDANFVSYYSRESYYESKLKTLFDILDRVFLKFPNPVSKNYLNFKCKLSDKTTSRNLGEDFADAYSGYISNGLDEKRFPNRVEWFKKCL